MAIRPPGSAGGVLRSRRDLQLLLASAQAELTAGRQPDYQRGIIASVRWALGQTADPPLSNRTLPAPTVDDLFQEEEVATKTMYGEYGRVEHLTQGFLVGVEATMLWARSRTDEPPIDLDYPVAS